MCCGTCLLFLCKIVDSFLATQKEKNKEQLYQRVANLRRRHAAALVGDLYSSDDNYTESSDSDDEREAGKQKLE